MSHLNFIATMEKSWSVEKFLTNLQNSMGAWAQIIVVIIGLVMLVVGIFQLAKGMMSGGRGQTNWFLAILLFFIGGALAFTGGWGLVKKVSKSGQQTVEDLGDDSLHNDSWQKDESIIIDLGDYIIFE